MVIILMVATTVPLFYPLLPAKIESIIAMGRQNVRHFSTCIQEFRWHDAELEKLDKVRNKINHLDAWLHVVKIAGSLNIVNGTIHDHRSYHIEF